MDAPQGWAAEDGQLYRCVGRHVQAGIETGELPAVTAPAGATTRLLAPLHRMLLDERAVADVPHAQLAAWLASACFGGRHLWQDLGVASRAEVSRLMHLAFPALSAANTLDLRWKRHLFACLGWLSGEAELRPPKCDRCGDFATCMGAPLPAAAGEAFLLRRR